MRIQGLEGLNESQVEDALRCGGRFVFFEYCISFFFFSLRRPSQVYFIPAHQRAWPRGLPYSLLTLLCGWWGLPWGVIYTPLALATNFVGGCDVSAQARSYLALHVPNRRNTDVSQCDTL